MTKNWETQKLIVDEMDSVIKPLLTPIQIQKLEEQKTRFQKDHHERESRSDKVKCSSNELK